MVLPSYSFIFIFLPIVILAYFGLNKRKLYSLGKAILLIASLVFYFSMGYKGFIAISISILVCYLISTFLFTSGISKSIQKIALTVGIILNIGALIYCKYLLYFESVINKYAGTNLTFTSIVIPVGISYYTFSQIAFLVDTYKDNNIKYSLLDYALFVTFFPKVTVGPIAFTTEMINDFNDSSLKAVDYSNMTKGFYRFTLGLCKKLLLADNLAAFVDYGYLNISSLGTTNALITIVCYTLQIYYDFSGYCDIASGICTMLNLSLVENFDAPYASLSIAQFWKRWHISLTRFFRNYLYIPLGGNRKGKIRTYINTMIIFLISGLWHGAATTFIVWGLIHGIGSIVSKILSPVTKKLPKIIRWTLTFSFVNLAWVFFRAPDLNFAFLMLKQLFTGGFTPIDNNMIATCVPVEGQLITWLTLITFPNLTYACGCLVLIVLMAISLICCTLVKPASVQASELKTTRGKLIIVVVLFVWAVLSLSQVSEFIYVNF